MTETTEQLCELRDRLESGGRTAVVSGGWSSFSICFAISMLVTIDAGPIALLLPIAIAAGLEFARNMRRLIEIKTLLFQLSVVESVADIVQVLQLAEAEPEGRA